MSKDQRIRFLEEQVRYLSSEKFEGLRAMELAASLGNFTTSLNKLDDPVPIMQETAIKIRSLIKMKALCFYLVNEDDSNFQPVLCQPSAELQFFINEVEQLIDTDTFAWCLSRNKPYVTTSQRGKEALIIHTLATTSRIRGVFVGVLEQERFSISDSSMSLFTILLHACAQMLESYELYAWNRRTFNKMKTKLEQQLCKEESINLLLKTKEKELESAQQQLARTTEQLNNELGKKHKLEAIVRTLAKQNRIMHKLSQQLSESVSLEENARLVTQAAATLTDSVHGFACWIDPDTQCVTLPDLDKTTIRHFSLQAYKAVHKNALPGDWGKTLLSGKTFYCDKPVETFPLQQGVKKTLGPIRLLSVPVLHASLPAISFIGHITLSNAPKPYGPAEAEAVERVASLFALSLQNRF